MKQNQKKQKILIMTKKYSLNKGIFFEMIVSNFSIQRYDNIDR